MAYISFNIALRFKVQWLCDTRVSQWLRRSYPIKDDFLFMQQVLELGFFRLISGLLLHQVTGLISFDEQLVVGHSGQEL